MKRIVTVMISIALVMVFIMGSIGDAAAEQRVAEIRTKEKGAALRNYPAGDKIASVHQYTDLKVINQENGWYYVYYNGMYGWVSGTMVTITKVVTVTTGTIETQTPRPVIVAVGNTDPYDMGVPYIGNTVFRENMMNLVVFWVQTQLKATGVWYQGYQWDVTGNLGDHTMSEIRSFMTACGHLGQTGVVNQDVIDALVNYLGDRIQPVMVGGFYDSMKTITTGDAFGTMYQITSNLRDMVPRETIGARWVQCVLKGLGYYTGTIDGKYGEKTEEAVKRFQHDYGFQERDYVTLGVARSMLEQYYWRGGNLSNLP